MTWRGVEHRFCPTCVLLLLEVIKCPTMGYDLAWCGASFWSHLCPAAARGHKVSHDGL